MRPPKLSLRERAAEALTVRAEDLAVTISIDPLIGAEFAGYRIVSAIGRGGMGAVYLADSERHERPVAVKVMLPELTGNEEFRDRFIREARSGLEHPNIVPILDAGDVDSVLYIAMEYVNGVDLKGLIARETKLSPARAVSIIEQAAAALDHAHENGIVHRDVKPQNILLKEKGGSAGRDQVFLTDFGLVKKISSQSSFTTSAYLMGTLHYMAPEQIEGKPLDGRTDVYALGCVLFECLTGSVPFDKESEVAVLWSHMNDAPPSAVNKDPLLSDAVDVVIAKAMAKSPDERFLTAGELASAMALELGASRGRARSVWGPGQISASGKRSRPLQKELAARAAAKAPPPPQPVALRTKGFAVGVAAATALFGVWFGFGSGSAERRAAVGDFVGEVAQAAPFIGEEDVTSEERDGDQVLGRRIEAAGPGSSKGSVSLDKLPNVPDRQPTIEDVGESDPLETTTEPPVTADEGPSAPRLPERIAFTSLKDEEKIGGQHALYTMKPDGTDIKLLFNSSNDDYDPAWSPDGKRIAFAASFRLYVMDADGGNVVAVSPAEGWARGPSWSPDGDKLTFAYSATADQTFDRTQGWGIAVVDLDDTRVIQAVTPLTGADHHPNWSPSGDSIAFTSYTSDPDGDVLTVGVDGGGSTVVAGGPGAQRQPTWAPDGKVIAYSGQRSPSSGFDLYLKNLANDTQRRVTHLGRAFSPTFSRDGNLLAFVGGYTEVNRRYEGLFYMTVARSGGKEKRLLRADYWDDTPSWR